MNGPYYDRHGVTVHAGDCLDVLRDIPDASVHAVICDPPYGLADIRPAQITAALTAWANGDREHVPNGRGFMGRDWDAFVPPPAVWDECLRVLTPGGHLAAFAGSRTYDLMGVSIRMAGFEIRDGLQWLYGSGMPKGQDVGKAIDKTAPRAGMFEAFASHFWEQWQASGLRRADFVPHFPHYKNADSVKAQLSNWKLAKNVPSVKDFEILRGLIGLSGDWSTLIERVEAEREVVTERTLVQGGGTTLQLRVGERREVCADITAPATPEAVQWDGWNTSLRPAHEPIVLARKPLSGTVAATVIAHGTGALHVDACRTHADDALAGRKRHGGGSAHSDSMSGPLNPDVRPEAPAGRWPANVLLDEGAAAELDEQSSGASRFFPTFRYQAKAPASERPKIDGISHPTVKPLTLMRWLARLVTPPGGLVLDPFAGSGTTLQAAHAEGFRAIGIEREPKYLPLINARLDGRPRAATGTQTATDNEPMDLLDLLTEDGAA